MGPPLIDSIKAKKNPALKADAKAFKAQDIDLCKLSAAIASVSHYVFMNVMRVIQSPLQVKDEFKSMRGFQIATDLKSSLHNPSLNNENGDRLKNIFHFYSPQKFSDDHFTRKKRGENLLKLYLLERAVGQMVCNVC